MYIICIKLFPICIFPIYRKIGLVEIFDVRCRGRKFIYVPSNFSNKITSLVTQSVEYWILFYLIERRHRGSRTNFCSSSTCSGRRDRLLSLGRCAARQEKSLETRGTPCFLETISLHFPSSKRYEFLAFESKPEEAFDR